MLVELSKLRPSATFLSLMGYRNNYSEIADYNIVFHMSYESALKRSIVTLDAIVPASDLEVQAKQELLESYNTSLTKMASTPIEEIDDAYTRFFDADGKYIKGVKMHTETGTLHLYGSVVHKKITMPGIYPKVNHRPLTIAKDRLRRLCPVDKFRQFKILPDQVDRITVENLSLLNV